MATIDLTRENFEKTVNENPMVVVDFWAPWCGPCKGFAPVYEQASEAHPEVVFAKVNTDEQQELAGTFGIQVITRAKSLDMNKVQEEIRKQNKESKKAEGRE